MINTGKRNSNAKQQKQIWVTLVQQFPNLDAFKVTRHAFKSTDVQDPPRQSETRAGTWTSIFLRNCTRETDIHNQG